MSTVSHLSALTQRHQLLEKQIIQELQHPSHDNLKIKELKRRKLDLKDQMAVLASEQRH